MTLVRSPFTLLFVALLMLAGCQPPVINMPETPEEAERRVELLMQSEEWILRQSPRLAKLDRAVMNLNLPDASARDLFETEVSVKGLSQDSPVLEFELPSLGVWAHRWPVESQQRSAGVEEVDVWRPLLAEASYFEWARFRFVKARFTDTELSQVASEIQFEGLAKTTQGKLLQVKAKQEVTWRKNGENWRIEGWNQKSLQSVGAERPLFRDMVALALPDSWQGRLTTSPHELMMESMAAPPHKYFSPHASDRHPSVSVVDLDGDGFDDFYLMARWGPNMMFRNRGDGTFEEVAAQVGLDIQDHCSGAIFADFDNDGDQDLFLGRTLARSMYLQNEKGKFVDRSAQVSTPLPYLTFSISSADYNGDGLMDVLLTTYAQELQDEAEPDPKNKTWLAEFLPREQAEHLYTLRESHGLFDRAGPPNVLLINRGGGKFDLAAENKQLQAWRQTTQGTWSDFDGDGDPDLYMSNDFAPNLMFRNDGAKGFVDITEQTGSADIGFGMGVSWGDYDLDGQQDLHVTNMYSKAGQRITSQLQASRPRLAQMSRGNSLLRNLGGRFEKVSGLELPALQVEKVGWSWSGQFVDIDNDGYLDIHALSGFYTAPDKYALPIDL